MMKKRLRKRRISKGSVQARLFADDEREVLRLVQLNQSSNSDILRALVSEALRVRRLHTAGKDVVTDNVKSAQKEVVNSELSPLIEAINKLDRSINKNREEANTFYNSLLKRIEAIEDMQDITLKLADATLVNIFFLRGVVWWHLVNDYLKRVKGKTTEECKSIYKKVIDSLRPIVLKERGRYNEKAIEQAVENARDELTSFSEN